MFTGIVEEVGQVKSLEPPSQPGGSTGLTIKATLVMEGLKLGDSIAVNGACLTAVALGDGSFSVDVAPETLRRTDLEAAEVGCGVNLERPLALGDRLGGHIVQGHVDSTGEVISISPEGDCVIMGFRAPERFMPYIVEKGFIAIDGISLTVVEKMDASFTISVIPYTLENTTLKERPIGAPVNLEVDILAKYVESLLHRE
jgi:riboflavin synthase